MDNRRNKKIAPIIITVLMILYFIAYFSIIIAVVPLALKIVLAIVPLALGGTMIYVCMERMNEIDGGEEDDLSKY